MRGSIIFILIAFAFGAYSQEPAYKKYTVKDGLPSATVYQSIQDKNGYIWFATNQGVSRFDGTSFKNFMKEDGLPDNDIIKIYVDSHNSLWFISMVGIPSVYNNGIIRSFPHCKNVTAISEDIINNKILLISVDIRSLGYYESENIPHQWNYVPYIKSINKIKAAFDWSILRYSNLMGMRLYFSFNDTSLTGIITNKKKRIKITSSFRWGNWIPPFGNQTFFSVFPNNESVVYYSSDSIYYFNATHSTSIQSLKELGLDKENDISSIYNEDSTRIWITTRNHGLILISNYLESKKTIKYFFKNSFCTSILKDREGGFWISTHNDGVFYIPNMSFRSLSEYPHLMTKDVKCIKSINKEVVVGGFADGNILAIETNNLTSKLHMKWASLNKNNRILDLYPFKETNLLVASDKGLYHLNSYGTFEKFSHVATKSVFVDIKNNIFAAVSFGVQQFKSGSRYKNIFEQRATCITGIGNTYYWGTLKGLYKYSESTLEDVSLMYPELSVIINHIGIADDSAIWVSTQQGIIIIKNKIIYKIKKEQGLASNTCKHILFDKNTAWVSTDQGVSRIDYAWKQGTPVLRISNITEADGLISNSVNQTALSHNFIWVATSGGISFFPKTFVSSSPFEPVININKISIGAHEVPLSDTIYIKRYQNLSIELSGISYRSGKQIQYEYRFSNQDKKWNQLANNKMEFTTLPFGDIKLEMRAIDRWGKRTKVPKMITLINEPPFWETKWFHALSYLLTAIIIGLFVNTYTRIHQKKKEKELYEKRKMLDLEMMALRSQINPHFIFNCLSSIQHHILKSDPVSANLYLHKLSTLIRKTLQSSASPTILLSEEISIIKIYLDLEKLRLEDKLEYALNFSNDIFKNEIKIPSMIIQPFIENAIKHGVFPLEGKNGYINIDIIRSDNCITCVIEDNGIGIQASKNMHQKSMYPSMGSNITEGRITAINSIQADQILLDIQDKKDLHSGDQGTIVKITFIITSQL